MLSILSAMPILIVMLIIGCVGVVVYKNYNKDHAGLYIKTELGYIWYGMADCELGMVLNKDGNNILDINSKPITCSGMIRMTDAEYRKTEGYTGE